MTRALSGALHGHLSEAVALNRGVLLVLKAALIMLIRDFHLCGWRLGQADRPSAGNRPSRRSS